MNAPLRPQAAPDGPAAPARRKKRDYRPLALFFVAVTVAALGYLVQHLPGRGTDTSQVEVQKKHGEIKPDASPFAGIPDSVEQVAREEAEIAAARPPESPADTEKQALRKQARTELAAKRFRNAFSPLDRLIKLAPDDAQAHVLMGLALEGAGNFKLARKYYEAAIDRDLLMADGYFGYATTSEALGELEAAIGGMRSFLHVQKDSDPYRQRVAQARSAIWEWESKLGRGPWGPTRGIPPGFTEEELRRDGRGVGTKMPIPGTEKPDGSMEYEIKHSDKIKMYKR
jgi:tetratricopeptide (TPR) repeat protein